jgi:hypothetical protein
MILQRNSDLVSAKIDDEIVLMSVKSGKYFGLNRSASRIWEHLEEPLELEELYSVLMREYKVNFETCRSDTDIFLKQLHEKSIVLFLDEQSQ